MARAGEATDIDRVIESRLQSLNFCFQCGACSSVCPFGLNVAFNPRQLILMSRLEPEKVYNSEQIWICSSCNACVTRCPMEVKPPEAFSSLRARAVERGDVPARVSKTLFLAFKGTSRYGNPWGKSRSERGKWATALGVKHPAEGVDILYDVGCGASYDPRAQKIAKAMVNVFRRARVNFGILGEEENCCGSCVRRMGEEGLFQMLADTNIKNWRTYKIKKLVTGSPHCYNVIKNEYPERPGEVLHYTQFLAELVQDKRLQFISDPPITVTYHDPCFLGRHNGVYDAPRQVLKALPGVTLIEMRNSKESAICCGGGGGRMWVEPVEEERMHLAEIRFREAAATGAQVLVTACQFCMVNFQEAAKVVGSHVEVKDLIELVNERLVPDQYQA